MITDYETNDHMNTQLMLNNHDNTISIADRKPFPILWADIGQPGGWSGEGDLTCLTGGFLVREPCAAPAVHEPQQKDF